MITGLLWTALIVLGAVAVIVCGAHLWAAAWHSDPKFADVDSLAENREDTNRRLAKHKTWRPGDAA